MYGSVKVREKDFSRTLYNDAKLGAYYTDTKHMASLAPLFSYTGDFYALDPGCGDMSAMFTLLNKEKNKNAKWCCGVELNSETASELRKNPNIYALVEGDFTQDLMSTSNAFDFVFTNPAYLDVDGEEADGKKKRLEMMYLERLSGANNKSGLMKKGSILVLVVNFAFFSERETIRFLMNRFETLHVWKFRPDEYKKFKQVVFVGRRIPNKIHLKEEIDEEVKKYDSESKIPVLPEKLPDELIGSIEVPHSKEGDLKRFTSITFDETAAAETLLAQPDIPDYRKWLSQKLTQKPYTSADIETPPVMPGLGNLFMQEVCGVGNGKTGDEGKDLHLARGIVEKVSVAEAVPDPSNKDKAIEKVTTMSKVKMKILEIVNEGGKPVTYISTLE